MGALLVIIGNNEIFHKINEKLKHRSPEKETLSVISNVSINQSFSTENKYYISYDGNLYEKNNLIAKLREKNCDIDEDADDAICVLHAYLIWGENCFQYLNGSWSFIIYDVQKNILFGSRDRFGLKPMFYVQNKNLFVFASETRSLMEIPNFQFSINTRAIQNHILWRDNSNDNQFISEITELPPAHYFLLHIPTGNLQIKKYYSLKYNNQLDLENFETNKLKYIMEIKEYLFSIMDTILQKDEKIAFCLSGGIDSSSLVSIAANLRKKENIIPLSGISGYEHSDEYKWASKVTEHYKINGEAIFVDEKIIWDTLPKVLELDNRPITGTSTSMLYLLMQRAKELGCAAIYDGQGGDELFAGYYSLYPAYLFQLLKKSAFSFVKEIKDIREYSSVSNLIKTIIKNFQTHYFPNNLNNNLLLKFHPEFSLLTKEFLSDKNKDYLWRNEPALATNLNKLLERYIAGDWMNTLIHWEDRVSANVGIKAQVPIMENYKFVEYALSIPANYKFHKGINKWILRESMRDIVPDTILNRKDKMGFPTPLVDWVTKLNPLIKEFIFDTSDNYQIVNRLDLQQQWDSIFEKREEKMISLIWRYFTFLKWEKMALEK